jgi:acyl-CoA dehydrogenase
MDARLKGKGLSLLAIEPANAEGFRRGRNLEKIGRHGQDTSELFFDDVFVPEENLLGETDGKGFFQLVQQLPWERLSVALGAVSIIERAVDLTIAYAKERHAFSQPLIGFQNTQFKLAECKTHAVVARSFVDSLMVQLMAGQLSAETAAMAKWWTTDLLGKVADECLQLFGGYGYMTEYPIARIWANARVTRIFGGSTEIMKLLIARSL